MDLFIEIAICFLILCILIESVLLYSTRNQIKNIFKKINDVESSLDKKKFDSYESNNPDNAFPLKTREYSKSIQRGEFLVRQYFNEIIKDNHHYNNFHIFHDVVFSINDKDGKGATRQIDHLLICPYGVYVFETKNWNGITCFGLNNENFFLLNHLEKALNQGRIKNGSMDIIASSIRKPYGMTLNFNFSSNDDVEFMSKKHYTDPVEQINTTGYHFEKFLNKYNKSDEFPEIAVNKVIIVKTSCKDDVLVMQSDPSVHYLPLDSKTDLVDFFTNTIKNNEPTLINRTSFICKLVASHTTKKYQIAE